MAKRHGKKIWYDDDGRIWSETPYVDGRRQGVAIKYYKDGTKKSEEPWADGIRVGSGIEYQENGMIAKEVEYADSVQSEVWYREMDRSGRKCYDKDQHNGIPTYYDENGIKKEGPPMVEGKLHGMVWVTMKTERSRWKPLVEGKRQGVMIKYHEDGSKSGEYSYVKEYKMVPRLCTIRTDRRDWNPTM